MPFTHLLDRPLIPKPRILSSEWAVPVGFQSLSASAGSRRCCHRSRPRFEAPAGSWEDKPASSAMSNRLSGKFVRPGA